MRQEESRGHVQTQTSFSDSDSSFVYEPDRVSLRSVLHRMSSIFHSYLGGGALSRQGSTRRGDSPSPIGSIASGDVSRQNSARRRGGPNPKNRNSTLLDVLVPGGGSRRSSIWSLGTMVVSAQVISDFDWKIVIGNYRVPRVQVHNECSNGNHQQQQSATSYNRRGSVSSRLEISSPPTTTDPMPSSGENGGAFLLAPPSHQRSDVIVKLTTASEDSDLNM